MKGGRTTAADVREGIRDGLLFMPLYLPMALSYAVTAKAAGWATWVIVLWSATIYAGSAQLACLSAMAAGAGLLELTLIACMANVRHGLVAMSATPYLEGISRRVLPVLCFTIATPSPGLLWAKTARGGDVRAYALASQLCQWGEWVLFTLLGAVLGGLVPPSWSRVVSFAGLAAFVGLIMPMAREEPHTGLAVMLGSGAVTLGLSAAGASQAAAIVGAAVGAAVPIVLGGRSRA